MRGWGDGGMGRWGDGGIGGRGDGENKLSCRLFNLYIASEQDACPGGHATKAALH